MERIISIKKIWNKGFVKLYQMPEEITINSIHNTTATVSRACRGKVIKNKAKHFQRLLVEHAGSSTEVLQFVPFVDSFDVKKYNAESLNKYYRFGYIKDNKFYTNLRNAINFYGWDKVKKLFPYKIDKDFVVFELKIMWGIVDHLRRHKLLSSMFAENWQSNRSKHKIEYFENDEVKVYECSLCFNREVAPLKLNEGNITRQELTNKGEFGLRYVTGFLAGWKNDPAVWDNFFGVRTVNPTQKETQELANTMLAMMKKYCDYAE